MSISVYGKAPAPSAPDGTVYYASGYTSTGQVTFSNFENGAYALVSPTSDSNVGVAGVTPNLFSIKSTSGSFTLKLEGEVSIATARAAGSIFNGYALGKIQYFNGKYIKFNPSTTVFEYYTSTDGVVWETTSIGYQPWNLSIANNMAFVGVKSNANAYYTSTDGTTWTSRTFPTTTHADLRLQHVFYIGTTYVAILSRSTANLSTVHSYTSTDGINWTFGANISSAAVATTQANFVYAAASSSTIVVLGDGSVTTSHSPYYSTTGTSWTSCGLSITKNSKAIEYLNGNFAFFLVGSTNASVQIYSSTAGTTTWSLSTAISSGGTNTPDIAGLIWDGSHYIFALDGSLVYLYSNTALSGTFTQHPLQPGTGISYVNSRYFTDSRMHVSKEISGTTLNFWGPSRFALYKYPNSPVYN